MGGPNWGSQCRCSDKAIILLNSLLEADIVLTHRSNFYSKKGNIRNIPAFQIQSNVPKMRNVSRVSPTATL